VTLERLAQAQWILREHGSGTREIVDYLLLSHLPQFQLGMELGIPRLSSTRCATD
jgi:molybdate-binding protein